MEILARINSMTTNGVNPCVGVMIRESLPQLEMHVHGHGQDLTCWQSRNKAWLVQHLDLSTPPGRGIACADATPFTPFQLTA
jgi:hypothetical protein